METTKKIVLVLVAAVLLFTLLQESALAEERKVNFKVDGVTCLSIAYTAETVPMQLSGVQSSKYNFEEDAVTVVFDDATVSIEDLMMTFKKENFPVVGEPVEIK